MTDYSTMTLEQLFTAIRAGDQGAKEYYDGIQRAQLEQVDAFANNHDMDRHGEFMRQFTPQIEALTAAGEYEKLRGVADEINAFYTQHGPALEVLTNYDSDAYKAFLEGLTPADLKEALNIELSAAGVKEFEADRHKFLLRYSIGECVALYEYMQHHKTRPLHSIKTVSPKEFLAATDKMSAVSFNGDNNEVLYTAGMLQKVAVQKQDSKTPIHNLIALNLDDLKKHGITLDMERLTPFDREVHDAITTLFTEGRTDVMTVEMIYRCMTGRVTNDKARITPRQREAITNSITKMMYTAIMIDASPEARAYGFDEVKYKGNLLYAEMVTASINGAVIDALHILREPILYKYANTTKRIGRMQMRLLDTPIVKNEDTIVLQAYLYRRIQAMKQGKNKSILYENLYSLLQIYDPGQNGKPLTPGALRKKKNDIRAKVKTIFDYWKAEWFIKDYEEKKEGQEIKSVTVKL